MLLKGLLGFFCIAIPLSVAAAAGEDARLSIAAMQGNNASVRSLLNQHADINGAQGDGTTALHWAAYRDDAEVAQLLIKAGAKLDVKARVGEMTPLFMAAKNGSATMIDVLVKAGANVNARNSNGTTPLMLAAAAGKTDAIRVLIEHGADVNAKEFTNGQTPIIFAAALNRGPAIRMLAEHGADLKVTTKVSEIKPYGGYREQNDDSERAKKSTMMGGNTALHFAAREGAMDAVQTLVQMGADANQVSTSDHLPPITQAIITGHFDIAKHLLDHGADPTIASDAGLTPLFATIDARWAQREWYPAPSAEREETNYLDLMKALLDHGANVNVRLGSPLWFRGFGNNGGPSTAGATAFWRATQANDLAAMKLLLAAGADPNIATTHGSTPLQVAAGMHHSTQGANMVPDARMEIVKFLVEEIRADVNAKDNNGYSVLHGAAFVGRNDILQYLADRGADIKVRANNISGRGDGGGDPVEVEPGKGDTVADMANGWSMNSSQYPETIALAIKLGSEFSNTCWASICVNPTRQDKASTDKNKEK